MFGSTQYALRQKTLAAILAIVLFGAGAVFAQTLEDNWNDFLHYTRIGRLDLAKGYAQAILTGEPDPVQMLALAEENRPGYMLLLKIIETPHDPELAEFGRKLLAVIEEGRFTRRADPKVIVGEIKRLSGTQRGRLAAVRRLENAGEYAIMYMLDAMADPARKDELPNIVWALPQVGRDAIRPLAAALQTDDVAIKSEIIIALGKGSLRYPQTLAYLKYVLEKDDSPQLRSLAEESIKQIDPSALQVSAAELFYHLAESYYYHFESLQPAEDANFANIWFWDPSGRRLTREKVDKSYFNELMAMRACEWALKADVEFGRAIGLWLAAFFKAESTGVDMPEYFGGAHADATVYATTAGPEYLHQALARAVKDKNAYVTLGVVEALAANAGEKSLLYRVGVDQPLVQALSFDDRAVRYSAAIAIAEAGPKEDFPETKLVVENLAEAIRGEPVESIRGTDLNSDANAWSQELVDSYAVRSAEVLLKLAQTRNPVIDLSRAKETLIDATKDKREQIQILAGRILAHLDSPDAQRAIAAMALAEDNSMAVRVVAFESLAISAKLNANKLDDGRVDAIYSLVSSRRTEPRLRSAAATAYGSLNLPSRKVKNLILDQAKS